MRTRKTSKKSRSQDDYSGFEIIFLVEEAPEGGYTARAAGVPIFAEADNLRVKFAQVRDAVRCHFDQENVPNMLRFR